MYYIWSLGHKYCIQYLSHYKYLVFIYLGFYVAYVHVISRWVVGRAEEISTYSSSAFCTVNCRPTASNYQLSHLRPCQEPNPGLRGGGQSVTTLPQWPLANPGNGVYISSLSSNICQFQVT